jgi:uncharacterized delta-60 repeat protein
LDESFAPRFTTTRGVVLETAALQADGRLVVAGNFSFVHGSPRRGLARLEESGMPDLTFDPGTGVAGPVHALAVQPDGRILVAGRFGSVQGQPRTALARLEADGRLDPTFAPQLSGGEPTGPTVYALAVQPDGRILLTGGFKTVAGQPRDGLARLEPDGRLDKSFDPGAGLNGGAGFALALEPDGRIWVGGNFARVDTVSTRGVARLEPNGRVDADFEAEVHWGEEPGQVYAVAPAPGGGVYVGGRFDAVDEQPLAHLARLGPAGRPDPGFAWRGELWGGPETIFEVLVTPEGEVIAAGGFDSVGDLPRASLVKITSAGEVVEAFDPGLRWTDTPRVHRVLRQPDGRLLAVGVFSRAGDQPRHCVARFRPDGTPDESFAGPELRFETVARARVLGGEPDGALLVVGNFERVNGQPRTNAARLRPDGQLDPAFKTELPDTANIYAGTRDPAGRWLIAGEFNRVGEAPCRNLARLLPDGQPDPTFVPPEINLPVLALALTPGGGILAGGWFTRVDQFRRLGLVRLLEDGSVDDAFDVRLESALSDPRVNALAVDEQGRIYVGGRFYLVNGQPRAHLARLQPDGSLDAEYAPELTWGGEAPEVRSLALAPGGRCVLGGTFQSLQDQPLPGLARLRPDGSLDPVFQPALQLRTDLPAAGVTSVLALPDHRIVATGTFATAGSGPGVDLVLLNERGQLLFTLVDETNAPPGATDREAALVASGGDGQLALIASGHFSLLPGGFAQGLARFSLAPAPPEFRLYISRETDQVVVDWWNAGRLEAAASPQGPWSEVPGTTAPYRVAVESDAGFYRLVR